MSFGRFSRVLTNPLYILGCIVLLQMWLNLNMSFWYGVAFLMIMAYIQNVSYGLQARAGTRSSNVFHLVTAVMANLVFFVTFRYLVKGNMTLSLLPAYMFATIFGSLHANLASRKIENLIGARTEAPKNQPQLLRFWPSIIVLLAILVIQVTFLPSMLSPWVITGLAALTVLDNFAFAVLRLARSSDNYWFHGITALFHISSAFLKLAIMFNYQMDWILFWPMTTGAVIGSVVGQYGARSVSDYINARFDSHVYGDKKIDLPLLQVSVFSLGMVVHLVIFGLVNWWNILLLLLCTFGQSISFVIVSRARQRNHDGYLVWSSAFSNCLWYLTMNQLALKSITPDKATPYLVGSTVGSLTGQNVAMHIEKRVNALMDTKTV